MNLGLLLISFSVFLLKEEYSIHDLYSPHDDKHRATIRTLILTLGELMLGIGCVSSLGSYLSVLLGTFPKVRVSESMILTNIFGMGSGMILVGVIGSYGYVAMAVVGLVYSLLTCWVWRNLPHDNIEFKCHEI